MSRFYSLRLQAELAGGWSLVREWGRIGQPGTVRCDPHHSLAEALSAGLRLARAKMRRGYRLD
jgi:predicted DNA-binding WGR domain protein